MMVVLQIVKFKLDTLAMVEVQTVKIAVQNINLILFSFLLQGRPIYMVKLFLMSCLIIYLQT